MKSFWILVLMFGACGCANTPLRDLGLVHSQAVEKQLRAEMRAHAATLNSKKDSRVIKPVDIDAGVERLRKVYPHFFLVTPDQATAFASGRFDDQLNRSVVTVKLSWLQKMCVAWDYEFHPLLIKLVQDDAKSPLRGARLELLVRWIDFTSWYMPRALNAADSPSPLTLPIP